MTDFSAKRLYSVVIRTVKGCNQYQIAAQSPSQAAILVMKQLGSKGVTINNSTVNAGIELLKPNECYARVDLLKLDEQYPNKYIYKTTHFYHIKTKITF